MSFDVVHASPEENLVEPSLSQRDQEINVFDAVSVVYIGQYSAGATIATNVLDKIIE